MWTLHCLCFVLQQKVNCLRRLSDADGSTSVVATDADDSTRVVATDADGSTRVVGTEATGNTTAVTTRRINPPRNKRKCYSSSWLSHPTTKIHCMGTGDTSLDESMLTAPTATIDCTTVNHTTFQSPTNERQRPSRVTDRPSRYRDSAFETQFQRTLRHQNCRKIKKRNPAEHDIINNRECQDLSRGECKQVPSISKQMTHEPTPTDRAQLQGIVRQKRQPKIGHHPRFITNFHQHPSGKLPADVQSSGNDRYYYTPSGNKNKKKTGNSRNSPKAPHLKKKNYTRRQALDRREPAVADSDDHTEFLIAPTNNTDSVTFSAPVQTNNMDSVTFSAPVQTNNTDSVTFSAPVQTNNTDSVTFSFDHDHSYSSHILSNVTAGDDVDLTHISNESIGNILQVTVPDGQYYTEHLPAAATFQLPPGTLLSFVVPGKRRLAKFKWQALFIDGLKQSNNK